MREVKFRVLIDCDWRYFTLGDLVCGATTTAEFTDYEFDAETWTQYAGLKDKNGNLIFEGDILKIYEPDEDSVCGNEFIYTAAIEYKKLQWMFNDGKYRVLGEHGWTHYATLSSMSERCEFEVIGNIHESPELLEAE